MFFGCQRRASGRYHADRSAPVDFDAAAANRAAAGASQSHATIVSPMTGIVARRHAEMGDMATPGKPLFTIYQPGTLRVTAFDVGQGMAVLVETPERRLLYDTGPLYGGDSEAGARVIVP